MTPNGNGDHRTHQDRTTAVVGRGRGDVEGGVEDRDHQDAAPLRRLEPASTNDAVSSLSRTQEPGRNRAVGRGDTELGRCSRPNQLTSTAAVSASA